jgi:predicted membrane-bound mannosyltransferase
VTEQDVGYIVWGALGATLVATEVMAWLGKTWLRLPSIAVTAADLQARTPWLATIILAGMAVLAVHLVFYPWPDLPPR